MPKAHVLPNTPCISSLFRTVVVLRMAFQCSLCFLGGPLLKILRAGSLHFPRHLFLFNTLCYHTLVFNICTELMFKGPAMADTALPETVQIRKLTPSPAVITCRRDTANNAQQSQGRSVTQLKQDGASLHLAGAFCHTEHLSKALLESCRVACAGVTGVTARSSSTVINSGRCFNPF